MAIEDSIDISLNRLPHNSCNELCVYLLLEFKRPAEATAYFQKAWRRTSNRPTLIFGLGRVAQLQGDSETAKKRYEEFLALENGRF